MCLFPYRSVIFRIRFRFFFFICGGPRTNPRERGLCGYLFLRRRRWRRRAFHRVCAAVIGPLARHRRVLLFGQAVTLRCVALGLPSFAKLPVLQRGGSRAHGGVRHRRFVFCFSFSSTCSVRNGGIVRIDSGIDALQVVIAKKIEIREHDRQQHEQLHGTIVQLPPRPSPLRIFSNPLPKHIRACFPSPSQIRRRRQQRAVRKGAGRRGQGMRGGGRRSGWPRAGIRRRAGRGG